PGTREGEGAARLPRRGRSEPRVRVSRVRLDRGRTGSETAARRVGRPRPVRRQAWPERRRRGRLSPRSEASGYGASPVASPPPDVNAVRFEPSTADAE